MSQKIKVKLGVSRPIGAAKKYASGAKGLKDGKISLELKQKILERDNYTCQCCGFQSKKYQEILHKNSNENDRREENLVTTCIFCHQCFNLEKVSIMRSGVLIWLPEISQIQLHHMARAIYVARISQGPAAESARKALDVLMARRDDVKQRLGTNDPFTLATVLQDYLGEKHYHHREAKLEGVRLFPLDRRIIKEAELEFNQFPQILAYWRSKDGPFGGKAPPQWISIYQNLKKLS